MVWDSGRRRLEHVRLSYDVEAAAQRIRAAGTHDEIAARSWRRDEEMMMDPKLAFWTAALINMTLVVTCAAAGWWNIRHRHLKRHRLLMHTAAALVGLFLACYVLKVVFLGKENLELWSRADVWWLRIHETIVLIMLIAGVRARVLARRFRHAGRLDPWRPDAPGLERARFRHRRAGRTAVVASLFALLTAAIILAGMVARSGASDRVRRPLEAVPLETVSLETVESADLGPPSSRANFDRRPACSPAAESASSRRRSCGLS